VETAADRLASGETMSGELSPHLEHEVADVLVDQVRRRALWWVEEV
jgi:hypothetical protein